MKASTKVMLAAERVRDSETVQKVTESVDEAAGRALNACGFISWGLGKIIPVKKVVSGAKALYRQYREETDVPEV